MNRKREARKLNVEPTRSNDSACPHSLSKYSYVTSDMRIKSLFCDSNFFNFKLRPDALSAKADAFRYMKYGLL